MPRRPTTRRRSARDGRPRRRVSVAAAQSIDWRDPSSMRPFISERGKIRARRVTGLSRRDQARLARAVRRARELALLPYVTDAPATSRGRPPRER